MVAARIDDLIGAQTNPTSRDYAKTGESPHQDTASAGTHGRGWKNFFSATENRKTLGNCILQRNEEGSSKSCVHLLKGTRTYADDSRILYRRNG